MFNKNKKFTCNKCGRIYKNHKWYIKHVSSCIKIPNNLSMKRKFICNKCNQTYIKHTCFKKHILSCSQIFKCNICDRIFQSKYGLDNHLLSHTYDKYTCYLCQTVFDTIYKFQYHMRKCCRV